MARRSVYKARDVLQQQCVCPKKHVMTPAEPRRCRSRFSLSKCVFAKCAEVRTVRVNSTRRALFQQRTSRPAFPGPQRGAPSCESTDCPDLIASPPSTSSGERRRQSIPDVETANSDPTPQNSILTNKSNTYVRNCTRLHERNFNQQ